MKSRVKKNEPAYGIFSNIGFSIAVYWEHRKSAVIYCAIGTVMRIAVPFLGIYLPKVVIDSLTAKASPAEFIVDVGGIALLLAVLTFVKKYTDNIIDEAFGVYGSYLFCIKGFEKKTSMDYELLEDPVFRKVEDRAASAAGNNHAPAMNLLRNLSNVVVNVLGFLLYGGLIAFVGSWIIGFLILSALINWAVLSHARRYEESMRETAAKENRKLRYISESARSLLFAKDIRLYSLQSMLSRIFDKHITEKERTQSRVENKYTLARLTDGLRILIRAGAAYSCLIYLRISGKITLGGVV